MLPLPTYDEAEKAKAAAAAAAAAETLKEFRRRSVHQEMTSVMQTSSRVGNDGIAFMAFIFIGWDFVYPSVSPIPAEGMVLSVDLAFP